MINRKTDSILDFLADVGGFVDAIYMIVEVLAEAFSLYVIKSKLAWLLVKIMPTKKSEEKFNNEIENKH